MGGSELRNRARAPGSCTGKRIGVSDVPRPPKQQDGGSDGSGPDQLRRGCVGHNQRRSFARISCGNGHNCGEGGVMAKVTYKMTGLRELETTLRQHPKAMGSSAGLNALRQGGEQIAKLDRAITPEGEGNLRER